MGPLPVDRNVLVLPLVLLATLMPVSVSRSNTWVRYIHYFVCPFLLQRSQAAECCSVGNVGIALDSCIGRRPVDVSCDSSLKWDSSIKLRNINSEQVLATWSAPATGRDINRYNVTVNTTGERVRIRPVMCYVRASVCAFTVTLSHTGD